MHKFLLFLCSLAIMTSCIREELPNAEADILTVSVAQNDLLNGAPIVENDRITLNVKPGYDVKKLALHFTLTPGATISPASGTERDFTQPQTYLVTSEDGRWTKQYTVSAMGGGIVTTYSFETIDTLSDKRYTTFAEFEGQKVSFTWASGNAGFALTGVPKQPSDYPTAQAEDGVKGKSLLLTTRSTGFLGTMFGRPLAAGNLCLGTFNPSNAIAEPLKATQFGIPFYHKPLVIKGYYQYQPGTQYYNAGKLANDGTIDQGDIYAVFYETSDTLKSLDGTNVLTHPSIVSMAKMSEMKATSGWTEFNLPFVMQPGREIDPLKLSAGYYKLAIVFTASRGGALFSGAVGSTLKVDEVQLVHE